MYLLNFAFSMYFEFLIKLCKVKWLLFPIVYLHATHIRTHYVKIGQKELPWNTKFCTCPTIPVNLQWNEGNKRKVLKNPAPNKEVIRFNKRYKMTCEHYLKHRWTSSYLYERISEIIDFPKLVSDLSIMVSISLEYSPTVRNKTNFYCRS